MSHSSPDAPARIAWVASMSCNRPEACARSLRSYIENLTRHGRTANFVVMDDSPDPRVREAYRTWIARLTREIGTPIRYIGWEDKIAFSRRLADYTAIPESLIRHGVVGDTMGEATATLSRYGANRNAFLLHTAGDCVFSADDDTLCRLAKTPGSTGGVGFGLRYPADVFVYRDRQAAFDALEFADDDLLALHEPLLGARVPALATREAGIDVPASFTAARVAVSCTGLVGDSGWGSASSCLFLSGSSFTRIVADEHAYRLALASREMTQAPQRLTFTIDVQRIMMTVPAMDNRRLLPPFMTLGRGQDHVFGLMLRHTCPTCCYAHIPYVVTHTPPGVRAVHPAGVLQSASGIDLSTLFAACLQEVAPAAATSDTATRLRAIGTTFREIGHLPRRDHAEVIRTLVMREVAQITEFLEWRLAQDAAAAPAWARDVKRFLALLQRSSRRPDFPVPLELWQGQSLDDARALSQRLIGEFGAFLCIWPDLVDAARALRVGDGQLSVTN